MVQNVKFSIEKFGCVQNNLNAFKTVSELKKYKAICHSLKTYSRMFVEILWIQGSPLETLWNQGTIQSSKYLISHLRYLELIIIIVTCIFGAYGPIMFALRVWVNFGASL